MQKKNLISIKITAGSIPIVIKGKKITIGDKLTQAQIPEIDEFNLTNILKILPKNLHHYLKVKENTSVLAGDIIAVKKGIFKKQIIKAPVAGLFMILDKNKGIVGIKKPKVGQDFIAWFNGEIAEVDKNKITMSISENVIIGKVGQGKPISGTLIVLKENLQVYELPTDIEQKILALKHATPDLIAKADALGAAAIVAETIEEPPFALPYLIIDNINFLKDSHTKSVVVYGDEKQLIFT